MRNTEYLSPLHITTVMLAPKLKSVVVVSALAATFAGTVFAAPEDWDINQPNYESIQSISVTPLTGTEYVAGIGRIEVESDGSKYTQPKGQSVTYALHGEAKVSKDKWRIRDIAYGIGGWVSNSGTLDGPYQGLGRFHSVVEGVSPKKHVKVSNKSFVVPLGASGLGEHAVESCNFYRNNQWKNAGMSALTIFNSDRDIFIPVVVHFAARVDYKNSITEWSQSRESLRYWRQATAFTSMPVRCLKSPPKPLAAKDPPPVPVGPQNLKMNVGVNQAALFMQPKNYTGPCPVEVNASGIIVTNGETAVKYRFESDKGELSPVYTVQVDQAHTANVITKFKLGKFATGGAASTFTAPGDPPSGGQGLGATELKAAPTQADVYQGFYRLHIVAPNQLVSTPASYKITCTAITPGNMIQKPGAPPIPPVLGVKPAKPGVAPGGTQNLKRLPN